MGQPVSPIPAVGVDSITLEVLRGGLGEFVKGDYVFERMPASPSISGARD